MSNFKNDSTDQELLAEALKALANFGESEVADEPEFLISEALAHVDFAYQKTRDASLHALHNVLASQKQTVLVTKSELSNAWEKVAYLGNRDVVRSQIGDIIDVAERRQSARYSQNLGNGTDLDISVDAAGKYATLWGAPGVQKFATAGAAAINAELTDFGFDSVDLALAAQDSRFAIFSAQVKMAGKESTFLVPTEIKSGSILLPSLFFGGSFAEFNKNNICQWAQAGGRTASSAVGLLDKLNNLAGPLVAVAEDTSEWTVGFDGGASVDLGSIDSPVIENFSTPDHLSAQARELGGEDFEQIFIEATAKCGLKAVQAAKQVVARGLKFAGVLHDQIVLESELTDGVVVGTHIRSASGKQYISVPVETRGDIALEPSIFKSKNSVKEWSDQELKTFAASDAVDFKVSAGSFKNQSFSSLYKAAIKLATAGDLSNAEEALNAIQSEFGQEHYEQSLKDIASLMVTASQSTSKEFSKYSNELQAKADDISVYISSRANLKDFGLLD